MPPPVASPLRSSIVDIPPAQPYQEVNAAEPPSPRTNLLMQLEEWWKTLKPWGNRIEGDYYEQTEVASRSRSNPCPKNDHTIAPLSLYGPRINATRICYRGGIYNIGETPTPKSLSGVMVYLSDTILHGTGTPAGLIQIVTPETHDRENSSKTMVGMLRAKLNEDTTARRTRADWLRAKLNMSERPLQQSVVLPRIGLESKIKLVGIKEVKPKSGYPYPNFRQYEIDLELCSARRVYKKFTLPLTQIGLPFEGVIKAEDIQLGRKIKRIHMCLAEQKEAENLAYEKKKPRFARCRDRYPENGGPLFLSKDGHGRNATFEIFDLVCEKIEKREIVEEWEVERMMKDAIDKFRAGRPKSVHSVEQGKELLIALLDEFKLIQAALPPRKPGHQQRLNDVKFLLGLTNSPRRPTVNS